MTAAPEASPKDPRARKRALPKPLPRIARPDATYLSHPAEQSGIAVGSQPSGMQSGSPALNGDADAALSKRRKVEAPEALAELSDAPAKGRNSIDSNLGEDAAAGGAETPTAGPASTKAPSRLKKMDSEDLDKRWADADWGMGDMEEDDNRPAPDVTVHQPQMQARPGANSQQHARLPPASAPADSHGSRRSGTSGEEPPSTNDPTAAAQSRQADLHAPEPHASLHLAAVAKNPDSPGPSACSFTDPAGLPDMGLLANLDALAQLQSLVQHATAQSSGAPARQPSPLNFGPLVQGHPDANGAPARSSLGRSEGADKRRSSALIPGLLGHTPPPQPPPTQHLPGPSWNSQLSAPLTLPGSSAASSLPSWQRHLMMPTPPPRPRVAPPRPTASPPPSSAASPAQGPPGLHLSAPESMSHWVRPPSRPLRAPTAGAGVAPQRPPSVFHPSSTTGVDRLAGPGPASGPTQPGSRPLLPGTELSIPGLELLVTALPPRGSTSPAPAKAADNDPLDDDTADLFGLASGARRDTIAAGHKQQGVAPPQGMPRSFDEELKRRQESISDDFWTVPAAASAKAQAATFTSGPLSAQAKLGQPAHQHQLGPSLEPPDRARSPAVVADQSGRSQSQEPNRRPSSPRVLRPVLQASDWPVPAPAPPALPCPPPYNPHDRPMRAPSPASRAGVPQPPASRPLSALSGATTLESVRPSPHVGSIAATPSIVQPSASRPPPGNSNEHTQRPPHPMLPLTLPRPGLPSPTSDLPGVQAQVLHLQQQTQKAQPRPPPGNPPGILLGPRALYVFPTPSALTNLASTSVPPPRPPPGAPPGSSAVTNGLTPLPRPVVLPTTTLQALYPPQQGPTGMQHRQPGALPTGPMYLHQVARPPHPSLPPAQPWLVQNLQPQQLRPAAPRPPPGEPPSQAAGAVARTGPAQPRVQSPAPEVLQCTALRTPQASFCHALKWQSCFQIQWRSMQMGDC